MAAARSEIAASRTAPIASSFANPRSGFLLQYPQGIACLHAPDLLRVSAEDHAQRTLFRQPEYVCHLARRNHTGLIEDDHLATNLTANARVLQDAFDRDGVRESNLLQLLDGAHRGSDGEHDTPRVHQPSPQFL